MVPCPNVEYICSRHARGEDEIYPLDDPLEQTMDFMMLLFHFSCHYSLMS